MREGVTQLILVRHGRTDFNAENRLQGQLDVPLSSEGEAQAARVAPVISWLRPRVIVCSPLQRAHQTAAAIGEACGVEPVDDPRLMEIDVGEWSGLRAEDLLRDDPRYEAGMVSGSDFRRPGGETGTEVMERIAGAIDAIAAEHQGGRLVVVSHGFALRTGMCRLLGGDYTESRLWGGLLNCSWSLMDRFSDEEASRRGLDGRWRLRAYNCTVPEKPGDPAGEGRVGRPPIVGV
ncbi:histidine phosphatase family protein [Acidipropionibacterium virtanenii]|uniref:Phosphoserine phosphatase 1 n=1 Tax=Acidipropionibacterium virtanenii TaxID=2057246 RepID=A0A344UV44_9ACTN|nr:histidine phosphatase family protein [Acidipropionibacterium virtanenii]AXE39142.1 Phosphoserine phosphatase 1 [Acidipropionibacterium virtanenii]